MTQKELIKYLKGNNKITNLLLAVLFIVCAVGCVCMGVGVFDTGTDKYDTIALIMGVLFAVVGLFSLTDAFGNSTVKTQLENLGKQGALGGLLEDFAQGKRFCKGNITIGNTYVLARGSDRITRIDELARVYEYKHTTNGVEDGHSVVGITKTGNKIGLGDIKRIEKTGDRVEDIFRALYARNQNIQFGYK